MNHWRHTASPSGSEHWPRATGRVDAQLDAHLMPRGGAHATPATRTVPGVTTRPGTSMRVIVFTGPDFAQPRRIQYAS
jgi:hypothetical protein